MSDETTAPEADLNDPDQTEAQRQPGEAVADEPADEEVPEGGLFGDNSVRKPEAAPHDVDAIQSGAARITRDQLAEIDNRRAQSDIATLVAACSSLLDELEA